MKLQDGFLSSFNHSQLSPPLPKWKTPETPKIYTILGQFASPDIHENKKAEFA
jgi:hypothetical protein